MAAAREDQAAAHKPGFGHFLHFKLPHSFLDTDMRSNFVFSSPSSFPSLLSPKFLKMHHTSVYLLVFRIDLKLNCAFMP